MNQWKNFSKGFIKENAVFALFLGLCPTLGVTTSATNGLGMGLATTFVLVMSNLVVSLVKNVIPDKVRIPAFIVIIASFVTIVDMLMQAFVPALSSSLGVFVKLIVVNCIILGRAEAFASKNNVKDSIVDALGMGIGFTVGLLIISIVREVMGAGTITLFPMGNFDGVIEIPGLIDAPARIFSLSPGALLVMGFLMAGFNWLLSIKKKNKEN